MSYDTYFITHCTNGTLIMNSFTANSFNIAPIELKLSMWIKDGKVYIPTKFHKNFRTLGFLSNLCITSSIPSYGCKNDQSISN